MPTENVIRVEFEATPAWWPQADTEKRACAVAAFLAMSPEKAEVYVSAHTIKIIVPIGIGEGGVLGEFRSTLNTAMDQLHDAWGARVLITEDSPALSDTRGNV